VEIVTLVDSFICEKELSKSLSSLNFDENILIKNASTEKIYEQVFDTVLSKGGNTIVVWPPKPPEIEKGVFLLDFQVMV